MAINLQFPLGTYTLGNPPSVETLKSDLSAVQTANNANETAIDAITTGKNQIIATYAPTGAGTTTINVGSARINRVTMPADTQTLAVTGGVAGQVFIIEIINTTSQGILTWFSGISWPDGVVPTLTGTNGKVDSFGFIQTGAATFEGFINGQNI